MVTSSSILRPVRHVSQRCARANWPIRAASKAIRMKTLMPLEGPPLIFPEFNEDIEDHSFEACHRFSNTANWLVPGAILVGRYPFVQRKVEAAAAEAELKDVVDAGVTIFVSLQGELPPQLEMPDEGINGYRPYAAKANDLAGSQLTYLHVPIENFRAPKFQPVTSLVKELQPRLQEGATCYVHCAGGKGRTGTISACLLASLYGLPAQEAFLRVQKTFGTRGKGDSFAESAEQEIYVKEYVEAMHRD